MTITVVRAFLYCIALGFGGRRGEEVGKERRNGLTSTTTRRGEGKFETQPHGRATTPPHHSHPPWTHSVLTSTGSRSSSSSASQGPTKAHEKDKQPPPSPSSSSPRRGVMLSSLKHVLLLALLLAPAACDYISGACRVAALSFCQSRSNLFCRSHRTYSHLCLPPPFSLLALPVLRCHCSFSPCMSLCMPHSHTASRNVPLCVSSPFSLPVNPPPKP